MVDTLEVDSRHYPHRSEHGAACSICTAVINSAEILIKSKITDIEGNLVFETVAEGGQALWDVNNFSGSRVASGVYIAYITDDLGQVTGITKILVVN